MKRFHDLIIYNFFFNMNVIEKNSDSPRLIVRLFDLRQFILKKTNYFVKITYFHELSSHLQPINLEKYRLVRIFF